MPSRRLRRAIRMLELLSTQPGMSISELAKALSCSHRTIHRDLQLLNDDGYATVRENGGYRLAKSIELPPIPMQSSELLAILICFLESDLRLSETGTELTNNAIRKMLSSWNQETRARWQQLVRRVRRSTGAQMLTPSDAQPLKLLADALLDPACYVTAVNRDEAQQITLEVRRLIGTLDGWFIQGTDVASKEEVQVPLQAIRSAADESNPNPTLPPSAVPPHHLETRSNTSRKPPDR